MSRQKIPSGNFQKSPGQGQDETRDSYLNREPPSEPLECPDCGNVYRGEQWHLPDQIDRPVDGEIENHRCPGCRKIRDDYYRGEIRMKGSFLHEHREEIAELIENEVKRAQETNPLAKFVDALEKDGELRILTTTDKLAERLGRKIKQSYGGSVEYEKSESITRVYWQRDLESASPDG